MGGDSWRELCPEGKRERPVPLVSVSISCNHCGGKLWKAE